MDETAGDGDIPVADSSLKKVVGLLDQGRYEDAMHLYYHAVVEEDLPEEELVAFGETLTRRGEVEAALGVFRNLLRRHPRGKLRAKTLLMTGLLYLYGKRQPAYAYRYITAALASDPEEPVRAQALEALREIDAMQKFRIRGK